MFKKKSSQEDSSVLYKKLEGPPAAGDFSYSGKCLTLVFNEKRTNKCLYIVSLVLLLN